jgi:hypothetical protein
MIHRQGGKAAGGLLKAAVIDDGMGEAEGRGLNNCCPLLVELTEFRAGVSSSCASLTHPGFRRCFWIAPSSDLTIATFTIPGTNRVDLHGTIARPASTFLGRQHKTEVILELFV